MFSDQVVRVTMRHLSGRFSRRVWEAMDKVELRVEGSLPVEVKICKRPTKAGFGGYRRLLQCPGCRRLSQVLGFNDARGWGCKKCLGWSARMVGAAARGTSDLLTDATLDALSG